MRISGPQSGDKDRLYGVHPIFSLVEHDGCRGLKHFVGDFHFRDAELFRDVLAHLRVGIVERGQAVHELDARIAGQLHQFGIDLIGQQQLDPFCPFLLWLAHRKPDIGIDEIDALDRFGQILADHDPRAGLAAIACASA